VTASRIKHILRAIAPKWRRKAIHSNSEKAPAEVFAQIYREKNWGGPQHDFYSGSGSYFPHLIDPYVAAVRAFLSKLPTPPVMVDIGCGDFTAASRIADLAHHYHACDVVPELIERNRRMFSGPGLTFHQLDARVDALPDGDVVIVKQVFQHLSNADISAILSKLARYPVWIVSEHVPAGPFTANWDIETGGYTRMRLNSGVDLAAAPFSITPKTAELLCQVVETGHPIQTHAYRF
jgi:SAM-dependent methyltransferase